MKIGQILDDAKQAYGLSYDKDLAGRLNVKPSAISNWRSGYSLPDTVTCERLAGITGIPLAKVLGIVGEARAISREEKAVWRKLAATAALVFFAFGLQLEAHAYTAPESSSTHELYLMRNARGGSEGPC